MGKTSTVNQNGRYSTGRNMNIRKSHSVSFAPLLTAATFVAAITSSQAGNFSNSFNGGLPAGAAIYGDAAIPAAGGYTNSGYLQLTTATASKNGAFVITNDLDAGAPVVSFTAHLKVLVGGGGRWDYADGLSFNFAPD